MTDSIKVLVVDDSVVMRKALSTVLSEADGIEVVGASANGKIALQRIPLSAPDIVTLDIEMPVLDGIETLKEIKAKHPEVQVIMVSALTQKGAKTTIDALRLGAFDYITKPTGKVDLEGSLQVLREELIPKIRQIGAMGAKATNKAKQARPAPAKSIALRQNLGSGLIKIIAIGVSTGGPNALNKVIPKLPGDLRVPVVMVQHMPPLFTKSLAEHLDKASQVRVVEAEEGMTLEAGTVYIAPGDYHMVLKSANDNVVIDLNQEAKENSCRPAVDPLFRSLIPIYGASICAVILTGMGNDGEIGCKMVADQGGGVIAQDEDTCVVWGMPRAVVEAGLADAVLPIDEIAGEIAARVKKFGIS